VRFFHADAVFETDGGNVAQQQQRAPQINK
jgi:hypothetical protein